MEEIFDNAPNEKEKRLEELNLFLETSVYPELGISSLEQEKEHDEISPEHGEISRRSLENIRSTVASYFEIETLDGRFNLLSYTREKERLIAEDLYPWIVKELGMVFSAGSIDLGELGISPNGIDFGFEAKIGAKLQEQEMEEIFEKNKVTPVEEGETAIGDKFGMWRQEFLQALRERMNAAASMDPAHERFFVTHNREIVLEELSKELEVVKKTAFLTINITPKNLLRVAEKGSYHSLFDLDKDLRDKRAQELGEAGYLEQRAITERALGVSYDREKEVIYGVYGSKNGFDELYGGAPVYGDIFIRLSPEVTEKAFFTEGDSLANVNTPSVALKLEKAGVDRLDYSKYARSRQISLEHAPLAKAIINLEKSKLEKLTGKYNSFIYLEAHIVGGLTAGEIDTINIQKRVLEGAEGGYQVDKGNPKEVIEQLLLNPFWSKKINILDENGNKCTRKVLKKEVFGKMSEKIVYES